MSTPIWKVKRKDRRKLKWSNWSLATISCHSSYLHTGYTWLVFPSMCKSSSSFIYISYWAQVWNTYKSVRHHCVYILERLNVYCVLRVYCSPLPAAEWRAVFQSNQLADHRVLEQTVCFQKKRQNIFPSYRMVDWNKHFARHLANSRWSRHLQFCLNKTGSEWSNPYSF